MKAAEQVLFDKSRPCDIWNGTTGPLALLAMKEPDDVFCVAGLKAKASLFVCARQTISMPIKYGKLMMCLLGELTQDGKYAYRHAHHAPSLPCTGVGIRSWVGSICTQQRQSSLTTDGCTFWIRLKSFTSLTPFLDRSPSSSRLVPVFLLCTRLLYMPEQASKKTEHQLPSV